MAYTALKPCSRIMRASPHQSNQQEKAAYNQLLLQEKEDAEEEEAPHRKSFTCDDPPCKQILSSNPSSISSNSPSPQLEQLPTFVAPQGLHSLQLPLEKECTRNRFAKHDHNGRHLVPLCEEEVCSQSFRDASFPASDFRQHYTRSSIRSMLQSKPKKPNSEHHDYYAKQKLYNHKKCGATNRGMYGLALDQTMSMYEPRGEKKRHSSACARDMISRKDVAMLKNRFCDVQPYSWEEEVRQAMAKSSLSKRPIKNVACKSGSAIAGGLQRSVSVKEQYESSALPSTLIIKRTDGPGNIDAAPICAEETAGAKLIQDPGVGGRMRTLNKGVAEEKRMWKGFNVVKSPSEERWEEAAQDEERQELQRRARSQSMRYDTHLRTSDLAGFGKADGTNAFYNDEAPEWAVYTRSGYVRPRKSDADASSTCCSSMMGRSFSMRDTRMGLVMECAACGTALHGAGGHLLCFCACCAAARSSTTSQATPSAQKKKGAGSGILRACRRLLGLSKKRQANL